MRKRKYHKLKAMLWAIVALFVLSIPLWSETENGMGLPGAIILAALFGYISFSHFRKMKSASDEDKAYEPPASSTVVEKVNYYKRLIYLSLVAFPVAAYFTISDLNDLQSGAEQSISLSAPIAFVYNQFGYWPAILFLPVLGFIIVLLFLRKIASLK